MPFRSTESDEDIIGKASTVLPPSQQQQRRKGIGTRVWLVISESGESRLEEVGKHAIMRRTGLPARDLRVLDPILSYPSTILGRERAIVVNLEHIKAIITAKEVLMVNSTNPLVVEFVRDLQHRVSCANGIPQQAMNGSGDDRDAEDVIECSWDSGCSPNVSVSAGPKLLPFEFRAVEACLESACRCLESETETLEQEAYPALDELTSKISTLNLDRVRQIKSRLVAISGRVQKVRDELEHLLDDDIDMAEMYLTEKIDGQSTDETNEEEEYNRSLEVEDERVRDSNSEVTNGFKPNIEELEMLLEAYFAQIDGILQKLSGMSEYVDDTEDYINIMLDDKQNQLLQMGVLLSTANIIISAGIVVVGLFGMNIRTGLFDWKPAQFWETAFGTIGGCIVLTLAAVGWGKKKNLLAL